mmetsp:Transcript_5522/g.12889  ORF Transcript_5522/g.12889 Transcript_5522/m.12889 type:complete len:199 (+) Transcript_5522:71-667(+)
MAMVTHTRSLDTMRRMSRSYVRPIDTPEGDLWPEPAPKPRSVMRVVSGGQTGVDRAALDAALAVDFPCGGWCPQGRRANDGPIAERYPLEETPSIDYKERMEWNIRDSDGTLILVWKRLTPGGGPWLTQKLANRQHKPHLVIDVSKEEDHDGAARDIIEWCEAAGIRVLNIAGAQETADCPVYQPSYSLLAKVLKFRK